MGAYVARRLLQMIPIILGVAGLVFALFTGVGEDPVRVGQFLGTAIHDTAQVAGAGLLYSERFAAPQALDSATVTKLVRNLFMIGVIPLMAFLYRRDSNLDTLRPRWYEFVPLFAIGFVALAAVRSIGDLYLPAVAAEGWTSMLSWASRASNWLLVMAMAGVGLGTSIANLRGIGLRPMSVGFAAAALVGGCLGFLWFNCHPAKIFMGDVGSLSLGGALGLVAVLCKQELLMVLVGGVLVAETVSVFLQVTSFKLTGRRIFRCTPLHHHFEFKGWSEARVTLSFWVASALLALASVVSLRL